MSRSVLKIFINENGIVILPDLIPGGRVKGLAFQGVE